MDETPIYFDMPGSRTIERKGKKEVRVRSTGAEKRRFTAVLACTAAGVMLPPMIIFKGKRELKKLKIPKGIVVKVQPKGWNDATLTKVNVITYQKLESFVGLGYIQRSLD